MCGLVAVWDQTGTGADALRARCTRMRDTLVHRGPDDADTWVDADTGLALGHRRLSIIDLSPAGRQPMASPSGRWHVVYNGEIYNFEILRTALGNRTWRGHSDTEVMVAALDTWGLDSTVEQLRGMFAIAAWDSVARQLWLVRDRVGQKPLYWCRAGRTILAGSELRALRVDPACPSEIDRDSIAELVAGGYIRAPRTALRGVHQVAPGCLVRIDADGTVEERRYWDPQTFARRQPEAATLEDAVDQLDDIVSEAVRLRAVADVPIGALLSGGIDSTLVTAMLQHAGGAVRTYTIGVEGDDYDESAYAQEVADHLGTAHTTLPLSTAELERLVPELVRMQDEPFADFSLLPTAMVCRLARDHVTVALAGDGGDELFGGYSRYSRAMRAWELVGKTPGPVRKGLRGVTRSLRGLHARGDLRIGRSRLTALLRRAEQLGAADLSAIYQLSTVSTTSPERYVRGASATVTRTLPELDGHPVRRMMLEDYLSYLPHDVLVKADRASMATSLELRAPLLDHRIAEVALSFPAEWSWAEGLGKRALRVLLERHVPKALWDREKRGFGVPIDRWLRGPLQGWAAELLDPTRLDRADLWNVKAVRARWDEHQAGSNHDVLLWAVLQVQAWLEHDPTGGPAGYRGAR